MCNSVPEYLGVNGLDQERGQPTLHFFECIVQGAQKYCAVMLQGCNACFEMSVSL